MRYHALPFPPAALSTSNSRLADEMLRKINSMKWEYKLLRFDADGDSVDLDKALNNVGEYDWELAGILHHPGDDESFYTAVFKRPKLK